MVSDRRAAGPVSPASEASADLPGSRARGCRLSASVLHCPLVVLSGKGTSLFADWALSSPERTRGPRAIGGEGRRGPRGPISDTVEPKIPPSLGTIPTCSLMLELSRRSPPHLASGFHVPGCFRRPEPDSCWEPHTGKGRHTCCLWSWKSRV